MEPYYTDGQMAVYCDRAETVLPTLPTQSVDLILTDPPYFRVKTEEWDRQWPDTDAYLAWLSGLFPEWRRVLKPNGSVYLFCGPDLAARTECLLGDTFRVLNSIRWVKEEGWHKKTDEEALRSFLSPWEAVLFAEQYGADSTAMGEAGYAAQCNVLHGRVFEELRTYLDHERQQAGVSKDECNIACGFVAQGGMASRKYFSASQWCLPTEAHYQALRALFNRHGGDYLAREYTALRAEYAALWSVYEAERHQYETEREAYLALRRPFIARDGVLSTDTWHFPTVAPYPGKHPCEKPLALLEYAIEASTRLGAVVLDCCAGSGSTLRAAKNVGRQAIGIEPDAHWCRQIVGRLAQEALPWDISA